MMIRLYRQARWLFSGATLLAIGGCVTNQQIRDLVRTEVARLPADLIGQFIAILFQGAAAGA